MNTYSSAVRSSFVAGAAALALVGCGNSISGLYGESNGVHMKFRSNGKVEIDILGPTQEASYVVEDGNVKISSPGQPVLLMKIDDKGCLDGGFMLGKLCKQ